jgi:hypothetical protein
MFLFNRTTGVFHDSFALGIGLPHLSYPPRAATGCDLSMRISRGPYLGRCWFYLGREIVAFFETVAQNYCAIEGSMSEI